VHSEAFNRLTAALGKLPGVGRRSAERMATRLVREREGLLAELGDALDAVRRTVRCCSKCGSITTVDREPCPLCTSASREGRLLCVVEDPGDVTLIERSGSFNGRYHALMGKLSPMRGEGPNDLRIRALLKRVQDEKVEEVVLALSTDVEGDATASYLTELLRKTGVKVSRLAFGLPVGSGLVYADALTLARAMKGRQDA
jgi:recombination protein RecR